MSTYALPPHVTAVDFLVDHVHQASELIEALLATLRDQWKPSSRSQPEIHVTCQVTPGADEVFELAHQLCFAPALARAVCTRLHELLGDDKPLLEVEVRLNRLTGLASLRVTAAVSASEGLGALEYAH